MILLTSAANRMHDAIHIPYTSPVLNLEKLNACHVNLCSSLRRRIDFSERRIARLSDFPQLFTFLCVAKRRAPNVTTTVNSSIKSFFHNFSKCSSAQSTAESLELSNISSTMSTEKDVGILCFANTCPGFSAILKQRFSDFVVHEVDPAGKVVKLTDLNVADEVKKAMEVEKSEVESAPLLPPNFGNPSWLKQRVKEGAEVEAVDLANVMEAFGSVATPDDTRRLQTFLEAIVQGDLETAQEPILFGESADKTYRTGLHQFFKLHLPFLVSDTADGADPSGKARKVRARMKHLPNTAQALAAAAGAGGEGEDKGEGGGEGGKKRERGGQREWGKGKHKKQRHAARFDTRGDRGHDPWAGKPKFVQCHLYKENVDTQQAISILSRTMGIQSKCFGFAGTKDKRAITVQRLSVFRQTAERLASLNSRLFNIRLGNFTYVEEGLTLGQLSGNHFTITLRDVVADSEDSISTAATALQNSGFINYYGLQRFGHGSAGTHAVGAALLNGQWQEAVELILGPRNARESATAAKTPLEAAQQEGEVEGEERKQQQVGEEGVEGVAAAEEASVPVERSDVSRARWLWRDSGDPAAVLAVMPRYMVAECALLEGLLKHGSSNLVQALGCIPRTMRMMYVHSYQSFLWNTAASHRMAAATATTAADSHGSGRVLEGDLVRIKQVPPPPPPPLPSTSNGTTASMAGTGDKTEEGHAGREEEEEEEGSPLSPLPSSFAVKRLDAADVASGKYSLDDVVLPLPGNTVIYPGNDTAQVYRATAALHGVDLDKCSHNVKEYSIEKLRGDYRHVVLKPQQYSWSLLKYTDPTQSLIKTDLEELAGVEGVVTGGGSVVEVESESKSAEALENTKEKLESAAGTECQPSIALQLKFILPSSAYATMAVRELLKTSSSVAYHRSLN